MTRNSRPCSDSRSDQHSAHRNHCQAVVRFLQKQGAWVIRLRAGWGMRRGLPDILACYEGRLIAVEVKTGRGRLSPHQQAELDRLREAGAVVCVGSADAVIRQLQESLPLPQPTLKL